MCELNKKSIYDINVKNKRIILRADFDVPVYCGEIMDSERIVAAASTIAYALDQRCRSILLLSHIGDPDCERDEDLSLRPVADLLSKLLSSRNKKVYFVADYREHYSDRLCFNPPRGSVILLENIRFLLEEKGTNQDKSRKANREMVIKFRRTIRKYGDVYVNDAFRFCHLAHSSLIGQHFEVRVAGLEMRKELAYFRAILLYPKRPFVAIIGGHKIKTKLRIIYNLLDVADEILVGGGLPFTFLKILNNMKIGDSIYAENCAALINKLMQKSEDHLVPIHLPVDFMVGHTDKCIPLSLFMAEDGIPSGEMGVDIAPMTMYRFKRIVEDAKTVLWHGPVGAIENEAYEDGSMCIMQAIITATERGAHSLIVGEETSMFCKKWGVDTRYSHVSPGAAGGHLLLGKSLPALQVLRNGDYSNCWASEIR